MKPESGSLPTDLQTWQWREIPPPAAAAAGGAKHAVRGGLIQLAVMLAVGALLFFWLRHRWAAYIVWALAALFLTGLLWLPGLRNGFERAGKWLAWAVGAGMTWALLAPMYFMVFGLGRVALQMRGRDPMRRRWDSAAATYWDDRAEITTKDHWTRQY